MMRTVIFFSFLTLLAPDLEAQNILALKSSGKESISTPLLFLSDTVFSDNKSGYLETQKLFHKQQKKGIALTTVGGLMIGGAVACLLDLSPFTRDERFIRPIGILLMDAGIGQTILGAVNLAKSKKTQRKLNERKTTVGFTPILSPSKGNVGHAINFRAGAAVSITF